MLGGMMIPLVVAAAALGTNYAAHGTIAGTIRVPGHGPHATEYTGANVIARNVADPLGDVITVLSGNLSQGDFGPDGRFTIMMPHPERVFRSTAMSWAPSTWGEDSPWMKLFDNARAWVG